MKKLSGISHKTILLLVDIILLLVDIGVFTYQTIRVLILPARRRKGNILSSLLSFFVGLLEKVIYFEKSILRQPVVFKHRYVKQALMLAVGFLVLLSSIEWTVGPSSTATVSETPAVITHEPAGDDVTVVTHHCTDLYASLPGRDFFGPGFPFYKTPPPVSGVPATVKRYIRYCVFRI